ncbi:MAG: acyl carrier protein [bacterium]|nr:acyl carrier protein [bacterium]
MLGKSPEDLSESGSLLDLGIIDSTGILELVQYIEETFEISVDDAELVPENFDSIDNLIGFIQKKSA